MADDDVGVSHPRVRAQLLGDLFGAAVRARRRVEAPVAGGDDGAGNAFGVGGIRAHVDVPADADRRGRAPVDLAALAIQRYGKMTDLRESRVCVDEHAC